MEDRISSLQKQNGGLFEQVSRLKRDLQREKEEVQRKQVEIDELTNKIELMEGADKTVRDLRERLEERDRMIARLKAQIDELLYGKQKVEEEIEELSQASV